MRRWRAIVVWLGTPLLLSACAYFGDHSPAYLAAQRREALVIPPGLMSPPDMGKLPPAPSTVPAKSGNTAPATAPVAATAGSPRPACASVPVLVPSPNVALVRAGGQRWLRVDASPTALWAPLQAFFVKRGFKIRHSRAEAGMFETDWRSSPIRGQESRVEKGLERLFSGLYAAGRKQRYRVRLEAGHAGATEIYVQSQEVREVIFGSSGTTDNAGHYWELDPPNPARDADMLNRLAVYLGAHPAVPSGVSAGSMEVSAGSNAAGQPILTMTTGTHVWSRVGVALAQAGADVLDASRAKHRYVVRFAADAKTKAARVATLDKERRRAGGRYEVMVAASAGTTVVTIASASPAEDAGAVALRNALQRNLQ